MKILQIINSLDRGGAETVVINQIKYLKALGHEVDLILLNSNSNRKEISLFDEFNILPLPKFHSKFLQFCSWLKWISIPSNYSKYDVIQGHLTLGSALITTSRIFNWKKTNRTTLIFVNHGVGTKVRPHQIFLNTFAFFTSDYFIIIAKTRFWSLMLNIKFFAKVRYIPNVIESKFSGSKPLFKNFDDKTNYLGESKLSLGTISRIDAARFPHKFLEFVSQFQERYLAPFIFRYGGAGPLYDQTLRDAQEHYLIENLTFMGLISDVNNFLFDLDIFVTLCVGEIPGIACLEAIDLGVTAVGIQLDKKYRAKDDDLVPSFTNLSHLTDFVLDLIHDPAKWDLFHRIQQNKFREFNNLDMWMDKYISLYSKSPKNN